jgi:hypothetical protein
MDVRQLGSGSGKGQHTYPLGDATPHVEKPERVSKQTPGLRDTRPRHTLALTDAAKQVFERA